MPSVRATTIDDVVATLPPAVEASTVPEEWLSEPDDLFISGLGFEDRSLAWPEILARAGYKARHCAYIQYATNRADNEARLPAMLTHLGVIGGAGAVRPLDVDDEAFAMALRELVQRIGVGDGDGTQHLPRVALDISVLANRALIRAVTVLLEAPITLKLLYSEARTYFPTKDEFSANPERWRSPDELGLERGVEIPFVSPEHPGEQSEHLPEAVVVIATFKKERARSIIDFVQPELLTNPGDRVIWLVGKPLHACDAWRLQAMRDINEIPDTQPCWETSTFDYRDTLVTLAQIHKERWKTEHLSLAPLGSKFQAVGASLFAYLYPDVRILLARPREYNARYSEGCRARWYVPFGSMPMLRSRLDTVGQLTVEWD